MRCAERIEDKASEIRVSIFEGSSKPIIYEIKRNHSFFTWLYSALRGNREWGVCDWLNELKTTKRSQQKNKGGKALKNYWVFILFIFIYIYLCVRRSEFDQLFRLFAWSFSKRCGRILNGMHNAPILFIVGFSRLLQSFSAPPFALVPSLHAVHVVGSIARFFCSIQRRCCISLSFSLAHTHTLRHFPVSYHSS